MDNYIINIDSSLSEESKTNSLISTDFNYRLPQALNNVTNLKMSSIELPNTSYLISKLKDNFYFKIYINDTEHTISLNEGNYLPIDLHKIIEEQLKNIDPDLEFELVPYQYVFKIYHSKETLFKLDFTHNSDYSSLGSILGFKENNYQDSHLYLAEKVVYVIDNNYCFLYMNNYGHVHHNNKRYLSKIIMSSQKYEMVFDGRLKYVSKNVIFKTPVTLELLHIRLEDPLGNLLNLNSTPFSFTLEISMIENQLLKRYKEISFYNQELMELILNDVMLTHYNKEVKTVKLGETYNKILKDNMVNHIYSEGGRSVSSQVEMINNTKGGISYSEMDGVEVQVSGIDGPVTKVVSDENLSGSEISIENYDNVSLKEVEEADLRNKKDKTKKKLKKLIKKFKKKYPEKYEDLKKDKKKLIKTVCVIVKKNKKKSIKSKIVY